MSSRCDVIQLYEGEISAIGVLLLTVTLNWLQNEFSPSIALEHRI